MVEVRIRPVVVPVACAHQVYLVEVAVVEVVVVVGKEVAHRSQSLSEVAEVSSALDHFHLFLVFHLDYSKARWSTVLGSDVPNQWM